MGFPIRKSPDQSLFNDSPKLIAAGRVLHRLPAPRHPPYALSSLTIKFSQDKKNAATFVQLSKNCLFLFPQNLGENFIVHTILSLREALHGLICHSEESKILWPSHRNPHEIATPPLEACDDNKQQRAGGADRDRTGDLRLAKPALSQLSYSPKPARIQSYADLWATSLAQPIF
jgi:hypothetical protein